MKETIRLTRFCSRAEYEAFLRGNILHNNTDHYLGGKGGSTSRGFCFTIDKPSKAWRYLKGLVSMDICMVLDIDRNILTKSIGKYVDYDNSTDTVIKSCLKPEYCTCSYSTLQAKLIEVVNPATFCTPEELHALRLFMRNRGRK